MRFASNALTGRGRTGDAVCGLPARRTCIPPFPRVRRTPPGAPDRVCARQTPILATVSTPRNAGVIACKRWPFSDVTGPSRHLLAGTGALNAGRRPDGSERRHEPNRFEVNRRLNSLFIGRTKGEPRGRLLHLAGWRAATGIAHGIDHRRGARAIARFHCSQAELNKLAASWPASRLWTPGIASRHSSPLGIDLTTPRMACCRQTFRNAGRGCILQSGSVRAAP